MSCHLFSSLHFVADSMGTAVRDRDLLYRASRSGRAMPNWKVVEGFL